MINKVLLTGNLGRDVELRQTANGTSNCFISVKTETGWNKNEQKMHYAYISCSAFGNNADYLAKAHKGDHVEIEGHCDSYKGRDGKYVQSIMVDKVTVIYQEKKVEVQEEPMDYSNIIPQETNRNDEFDMPF